MGDKRKPCPLCDMELAEMTPLEAFVFGSGLVMSFSGGVAGFRQLRDTLCETHAEAHAASMRRHTNRLRGQSLGVS